MAKALLNEDLQCVVVGVADRGKLIRHAGELREGGERAAYRVSLSGRTVEARVRQ